MLTWALAERLRDRPVTANALSPGYVLSDLTRNVGGLLKVVGGADCTSFRAQTPLDGAGHHHRAGWPARRWKGVTGKFWNKRREVRCRFQDTAAVEQL
jgi:NAD(P)-dependent dehydrogenase (short-subunit alcohol dehydrogenase family)